MLKDVYTHTLRRLGLAPHEGPNFARAFEEYQRTPVAEFNLSPNISIGTVYSRWNWCCTQVGRDRFPFFLGTSAYCRSPTRYATSSDQRIFSYYACQNPYAIVHVNRSRTYVGVRSRF
jgi:hypothetical protein